MLVVMVVIILLMGKLQQQVLEVQVAVEEGLELHLGVVKKEG